MGAVFAERDQIGQVVWCARASGINVMYVEWSPALTTLQMVP